ncbi:MAG: MBL fold metallo-hydrolase [Gammaproteobacteria bacterium]
MPLQVKQIVGNSFIIVGGPKVPVVGLITDGGNPKHAVLIDSGIDEVAAKAIDKAILDGYALQGIINTHHHADHCGGNNYFQTKYPNIKIFATYSEQPLIEHTDLEPMYLSGGAKPFSFIGANKFLHPKPSRVTDIIPDESEGVVLSIGDIKCTVRDLRGHTKGMIGISTNDGVLYCADAFFGLQTLNEHKILFHTDIAASLATLKKIEDLNVKYSHVVIYHGGFIEDVHGLIGVNRKQILEVNDFILEAIKNSVKLTIDDLLATLIGKFEPGPLLPPQIILNRTVLQAHLSFLESSQRILLTAENGYVFCSIHPAAHVSSVPNVISNTTPK